MEKIMLVFYERTLKKNKTIIYINLNLYLKKL